MGICVFLKAPMYVEMFKILQTLQYKEISMWLKTKNIQI